MMPAPRAISQGWEIASRTVAAIAGGYGFIWLMTPALSLLLPRVMDITPFDSVLAVTMASFLVWAIAAMAVFHARSVIRAWTGLLLGSIVSMAILFLLTGRLLP
jgi:hypothetical protein